MLQKSTLKIKLYLNSTYALLMLYLNSTTHLHSRQILPGREHARIQLITMKFSREFLSNTANTDTRQANTDTRQANTDTRQADTDTRQADTDTRQADTECSVQVELK